uniref:Uncharacterized protein n=1 Tax=Anguilla anguilla TaxID=7936 RepID=A0A0E9WVG2_ANGAN
MVTLHSRRYGVRILLQSAFIFCTQANKEKKKVKTVAKSIYTQAHCGITNGDF